MFRDVSQIEFAKIKNKIEIPNLRIGMSNQYENECIITKRDIIKQKKLCFKLQNLTMK
jgi:hypothetical protein